MNADPFEMLLSDMGYTVGVGLEGGDDDDDTGGAGGGNESIQCRTS